MPDGSEAQQLQEELAAALDGSQVLEHAGRALLLLRLHVNDTQLAQVCLDSAAFQAGSAHFRLSMIGEGVPQPASVVGDPGDPGPQSAMRRIRNVASGRCARHAVLCLGLAVLCDADGGNAFGLPPELLAALPVEMNSSAGSGGPPHASRVMSTSAAMQLQGMLGWLSLAAAPPMGRRATIALAMRVGWLAAASARSLTDGDGDGASGSGGAASSGTTSSGARSGGSGPAGGGGIVGGGTPPQRGRPRRLMPGPMVAQVAIDALQVAWLSLALIRPTAAASVAAVAEAARWWRLAVAVAADVVPYMSSSREPVMLGLQMSWLRWAAKDGLLSLPAEPPPETAAALEGGLLRCLERLMRRAGRDPQGQEAAVLREVYMQALCARNGMGFWSYVAPLLAYGEQREGAALLATLRKLLRTVDPRVLTAKPWAPEANTHQCFVAMAWGVLTAVASEDPEHVALGGGPPPSPASQQLLRLLSLAVCQLIPELSGMTLQLLLSDACAGPIKEEAPVKALFWVGFCGRQCTKGSGSSPSLPVDERGAGRGTEGDTAVSSEATGGRDDGGWRELLLEEVAAVPLLDAALRRLVPRLAESIPQEQHRLSLLSNLAAGCCEVAALVAEPVPLKAVAGTSSEQLGQEGAASIAAGGLVPQPAAHSAAPPSASSSGSPIVGRFTSVSQHPSLNRINVWCKLGAITVAVCTE
ncbi:hypothetical protein GPECTOR_52g6 [Gonium pectorale]|uniref:Uncharacterized protein n=1 Tax=Gonium pectorale TaxID=33097 RepID=A0A150G766_GONPE|nr:hypothetical protein GPECTOR_52g6 [Gonium pectorale]|eukprot:KXZ45661.1 hypothetical protein GPECTOR_52g6 [Gonium pectorale]